MKKKMILKLALAMIIFACCTSKRITSNALESESVTASGDCPKYTGKRYDCYSAKKCGGKILSHRDPHNCKQKSKGKSIYDNETCQCLKLKDVNPPKKNKKKK